METADGSMPDRGASARHSLVKAEDLSLGYGGKIVLSRVRLRIEAGEICGFRGPNGSGKSTFLKACLGLLTPSTGALRVLGRVPGGPGFRATLRRIGYVPQQRPPGALRVTVREAVSMGRYGATGLGRPLSTRDRRVVESAMDASGILDLADRPVQELSGGQYQRTNIARALAMEPELMIFDEPSTSLDALGRDEVTALLERLARKRGAGMVLVSHDEELLDLCDRVFEFGDGSVRPGVPEPTEREFRNA